MASSGSPRVLAKWLYCRKTPALAIRVTARAARMRRRFEPKSGGGESFIVALGTASSDYSDKIARKLRRVCPLVNQPSVAGLAIGGLLDPNQGMGEKRYQALDGMRGLCALF